MATTFYVSPGTHVKGNRIKSRYLYYYNITRREPPWRLQCGGEINCDLYADICNNNYYCINPLGTKHFACIPTYYILVKISGKKRKKLRLK